MVTEKTVFQWKNFGSPEKSFVSRQVARTQRKISGFRQENMAETPPFSLFSLSSLLISTFFQWSQFCNCADQAFCAICVFFTE